MNRKQKQVKTWCLLLGALCLFTTGSNAQYLSKFYDFDTTNDFGRNVVLQSDGSYFVFEAGTRKRSNQEQVRCYSISADGSVVNNKHAYGFQNLHTYMGDLGKISISPTGNYIIPCILNSGSQYLMQAAGMMKLKPDGDTIFTAFYTNTSYQLEISNDVACSKNGQYYYVAGFTYDTSLEYGSEFGLLLITDTNGHLIRRLTLSRKAGIMPLQSGVGSELHSIEPLPNGQILVGGGNGNIDNLVDSRNYGIPFTHMRPWFIIADSMGNIIKDATLGDEFTDGGNVRTDRLGGYLHWGALDSLMIYNNSLAYQNFPYYVAHLDSNFKITWLHVYGSKRSHTNIYKTMQLRNGDYLSVGIKKGEEGHGGFASRITRTGIVKWEHAYMTSDTTSDNVLVDAAERPDGSLVMIGSSFRNKNLPAYRGQDTWLLSVDSNGCEMPGCSLGLAVPREPAIAYEGIVAYPNPTSGQLSVQSSESGVLSFYNIQGARVGSYEIKAGSSEFRLPATLSTGIYTGRFIATSGKRNDIIRIVYHP